ncbi:caffeoylshikimate esterase-like [Prosopis cineraria]|uniref:caffeoylshikimate esterase-like n=1 Tax=Prosopis cineraria TaxID=364024 RepID=UPI0024104A83|nr:caffeoylshikimate esterase-like [Prosopis cineraria]
MESNKTDIRYEEEFIMNSRGMKLLTTRWVPMEREAKGLIFICHGYAMECSITMSSTARRLARAGYGVYGIDYEGHGKSDGLSALVTDFDALVNDCSHYFSSISEKEENKKKMRFLLGESMGGAVALLLHRKMPHFWDGAILVAPMCKIAEEMKPNAATIKVLTLLSKVIPTWKIIPTQDIIDAAFKVPQVRNQVRANSYCYKGRPRLKTGFELLRVSSEIEKTLHEVSLPFLVLHGEEDKVTDPSVSSELYEVASSTDKTLKLYPSMWHGLLYGEPPEHLNIVFSDIISWLDHRSSLSNSRLEKELKHINEPLK